jgi:hypothetical protein
MTDKKIKRLSLQSIARTVGRMLLAVISILSVCLLMLVGLLLAWSPGKPKPFVDENGNPLAGSISEKIHLNISSVQQGMFIKSKDATNPVLLFLNELPNLTDKFEIVGWRLEC